MGNRNTTSRTSLAAKAGASLHRAAAASAAMLPVLLAMVLTASCWTAQISSWPSGAEVWRGEKFLGRTPCEVQLPASTYPKKVALPWVLTFKLNGHAEEARFIPGDLERVESKFLIDYTFKYVPWDVQQQVPQPQPYYGQPMQPQYQQPQQGQPYQYY